MDSTLISSLGQAGLLKAGLRWFDLMERDYISPNLVLFSTLFKLARKLGDHAKAAALFCQLRTVGMALISSPTTLCSMSRAKLLRQAHNLFDKMLYGDQVITPITVSYPTIIFIWGRAGKIDRAAMLLQKLKPSGIKIDLVFYQTILVVYERAGLVGHAKRLLHDLKRHEEMNIPKEAIITIFANAGWVEEATWVFQQAIEAGEVKNISVFRAMMDQFLRNRKCKNVMEVFNRMRATGW